MVYRLDGMKTGRSLGSKLQGWRPVDGSEKFWNSTGEPVDSMEEAEK